MDQKTCYWLLCSLVILCGSFSLSFGQSDQLPSQIRKGTLRTTDGYTLKFQNLSSSGKTVSFLKKGTSTKQDVPIENIFQIEERKGSWALEIGLAGAAFGAVVGLLNKGRIQQEEDDLRRQGYTVIETDPTVLVLAPTLAGALGGLIGGAFIKKDKIVFTNPGSGKAIGIMRFEGGSFNGLAGLRCSYRF